MPQGSVGAGAGATVGKMLGFERATKSGVTIRESEVIGLLPEDALVQLAKEALVATGFSREQVLEARVLDTLLP